jgi:hypothetical protein
VERGAAVGGAPFGNAQTSKHTGLKARRLLDDRAALEDISIGRCRSRYFDDYYSFLHRAYLWQRQGGLRAQLAAPRSPPKQHSGKTRDLMGYAREDKFSRPQEQPAMDKTVAELNIQHFKKLLETETDPAKK